LPGYGWIFPLGDGRVNVGVGLLSTFRDYKAINTSRLMEAFVSHAPATWDIRPETSCGPPTGGKLPMGLSVGPRSGRGWLVAGGVGAMVNLFDGEGVAYAYGAGGFAAEAISAGVGAGADGIVAMAACGAGLQAEYGLYVKVARAFVRII